MPTQNVPNMTPVPAFPALSERAAGTYNSKAYAFGNHMSAAFNAELLAVANNVKYNADDAKVSADTAALSVIAAAAREAAAASSASAAASSANAAAASAGGQLWVSGTTYAVGALVFSALTGRNYRRVVAGAGTTDPSADSTNWRATLLDVDTGMPTIRPTLLLDFANSRIVDPRITFTRASTATYFDAQGIMRTATAGVPRINHDPVTGECKGLLVEETRTNLYTHSGDFTHAVWAKGPNLSITGGAKAPDGSTSATTFTYSAVGNAFVSQSITMEANTWYTLSVHARLKSGPAPTIGKLLIADGAAGARAELQAASQVVDSKWRRYSLTFLNVTAGTYAVYVGADFATNVQLEFWGAQIEVGNSASSYIPTAAASVTRAADVALMDGLNFSSWYRQEEGTLLIQRTDAALIATGVNEFLIADASLTNTVRFRQGAVIAGGDMVATFGGAISIDTASFSVTPGTSYRAALALKKDDFVFAANGSVVDTDTSGDLGEMTRMLFPTSGISTYQCVAYYPKRLSNAELQALTAP